MSASIPGRTNHRTPLASSEDLSTSVGLVGYRTAGANALADGGTANGVLGGDRGGIITDGGIESGSRTVLGTGAVMARAGAAITEGQFFTNNATGFVVPAAGGAVPLGYVQKGTAVAAGDWVEVDFTGAVDEAI